MNTAKHNATPKVGTTTTRISATGVSATGATTTESSTTWSSKPSNGDWYAATNWSKGLPTKKAAFKKSSTLSIIFTKTGDKVENIVFSAGAPTYTFTFSGHNSTPSLTITGDGITNKSKSKQHFTVASNGVSYKQPQLMFKNQASAGGNNIRYSAGPGPDVYSGSSPTSGYGGGIIGFCDNTTAGSALFTVTTGAIPPPKYPFKSTVGGEVSFSQYATADKANFTIYGSTSSTDGDTFGNVVFHDSSTAAKAIFTNIGGTMTFKSSTGKVTGGGDGGNTQFYDNSTAANAIFDNKGATALHANGGDVAFDGTANAGQATFNNHPATVYGAFGGVTSFNNNPPNVSAYGTSAGHAHINNYGASKIAKGGGGHTEFTALHGSPTAKHALIHNYGSEIAGSPSKFGNAGMAGHTIFSTSLPSDYFPTAGNATIYNHPGTIKKAAAGFTEFSVYGNSNISGSNVPTAGHGTFINLGADFKGADGGYTSFSGSSSAGNATLIANGGINNGNGGKIAFYDDATGDAANVQLFGNGTLDISKHKGGLVISSLYSASTEAVINIQLGSETTELMLTTALNIQSNARLSFSFWAIKGEKIKSGTNYTILTAPNMSSFTSTSFKGVLYEYKKKTTNYRKKAAEFTLVDNKLQVCFL